jgi:hypothetical protein
MDFLIQLFEVGSEENIHESEKSGGLIVHSEKP